jgi:hypothetical protein
VLQAGATKSQILRYCSQISRFGPIVEMVIPNFGDRILEFIALFCNAVQRISFVIPFVVFLFFWPCRFQAQREKSGNPCLYFPATVALTVYFCDDHRAKRTCLMN